MFSFRRRRRYAPTISTPSWWKMVYHKIRRSYLCYFNPEYVKENEAARTGECFGCGKCCTLVFRCVFLEGSEEQARCQIYDIGRPKPCGAFPIDPKDLADVNFLCGYSFLPAPVLPEKETAIPAFGGNSGAEPAFHLIRKIETTGSAQSPLVEATLIGD